MSQPPQAQHTPTASTTVPNNTASTPVPNSSMQFMQQQQAPKPTATTTYTNSTTQQQQQQPPSATTTTSMPSTSSASSVSSTTPTAYTMTPQQQQQLLMQQQAVAAAKAKYSPVVTATQPQTAIGVSTAGARRVNPTTATGSAAPVSSIGGSPALSPYPSSKWQPNTVAVSRPVCWQHCIWIGLDCIALCH
jgi:hypothetical protein